MQEIVDITNHGTDDLRIIYSPGFYDTPPRYIAIVAWNVGI